MDHLDVEFAAFDIKKPTNKATSSENRFLEKKTINATLFFLTHNVDLEIFKASCRKLLIDLSIGGRRVLLRRYHSAVFMPKLIVTAPTVLSP